MSLDIKEKKDEKYHIDVPRTARNSELILVGAPPHKSRSAIDPQEDKRGLPHHRSRLRVGALLPDVRIPILSGRDDAVRVGSPVDGGDQLVVL